MCKKSDIRMSIKDLKKKYNGRRANPILGTDQMSYRTVAGI